MRYQSVSKRRPLRVAYLVPALQLEVALGEVQVERKLHGVDFLLFVGAEVKHLGRVRQGLRVARSCLTVVLALEELGSLL